MTPTSAVGTSPATNVQLEAENVLREDRRLLARLKARDPNAASALHRRTRAMVTSTVNRLLGRRDEESEDVVQLAFLELVQSIGSFRGDGPLDAWVRVVCSRVVYQHIRRRRLDRVVHFVPTETIPGRSEVTTRDLAFRDALRRIRRHLALVEPKRSLTFLLHDIYGHDIREVASMTGVGVAAAKTRLTRARREIHERAQSDVDLAHLRGELSRAPDP